MSEDILGKPINIRDVAKLIGLSPWSVRHRLIPKGLPHFRSGASGRLIFYTNQVVRWIEDQQKGGKQSGSLEKRTGLVGLLVRRRRPAPGIDRHR
jgi:hypothetical protein